MQYVKTGGPPGFTTVIPNKQYIHYFLYMDTFANYLSILWNEKWRNNYMEVSGFSDA
jgi:hypothetical protein